MLIAQLSDTHLAEPGHTVNGIDPAGQLSQAVTKIAEFKDPKIDAVLMTGDLTNGGEGNGYTRLRQIVDRLACPVYVIPGNHDDRDGLRRAFADCRWMPTSGYLNYVVALDGLRLVCLDTLHVGHEGGRLCPERLGWLEAALAEGNGTPTLIAMHHPPFIGGLSAFDCDSLEGEAEFSTILRRHPEVERIVCGHFHRPMTTRWAGHTVSVAPSTAFHIRLTLQADARHELSHEPLGFQVHQWTPGRGLVTHSAYL